VDEFFLTLARLALRHLIRVSALDIISFAMSPKDQRRTI
jgi:hypothetical protein